MTAIYNAADKQTNQFETYALADAAVKMMQLQGENIHTYSSNYNKKTQTTTLKSGKTPLVKYYPDKLEALTKCDSTSDPGIQTLIASLKTIGKTNPIPKIYIHNFNLKQLNAFVEALEKQEPVPSVLLDLGHKQRKTLEDPTNYPLVTQIIAKLQQQNSKVQTKTGSPIETIPADIPQPSTPTPADQQDPPPTGSPGAGAPPRSPTAGPLM